MTQETRATKGGQQGKNGEWYNGGQFLPSSINTEKGAFGTRTGKAQQQESKAANAELNQRINDTLSTWYPGRTWSQARELYTRYLQDNGINTYHINPFNTDLAKWVL